MRRRKGYKQWIVHFRKPRRCVQTNSHNARYQSCMHVHIVAVLSKKNDPLLNCTNCLPKVYLQSALHSANSGPP